MKEIVRTYFAVIPFLLTLFAAIAPAQLQAQEYFDVQTFSCKETLGASSYRANVDVPTEGDRATVRSVKKWICEMLEVPVPANPDQADFPRLIDRSCKEYLKHADRSARKVEIVWSFEDPTCVTFMATISDKDSVMWTTTDCASFSKADGHRIRVDEIFTCDELQIKRLMWDARDDLKLDAHRAESLFVGDAGFVDGAIVVIGPAQNSGGAPFVIPYPDAEPYLRKSPNATGYYMGP
ncbi:MAG: hypothetical protein IJM81_11020 [Prevotella sp.]|nr:hypothetical protein [Prevotella sp.]